jgi:hypothetical protein
LILHRVEVERKRLEREALADAIAAALKSAAEPADLGTTDPVTMPGMSPETTREAKGMPINPDDLADTDWKILDVLYSMGAIGRKNRTSVPVIAAKAELGNPDSNHIRHSIKRLGALGLIASRKGIGTWMTQKGAEFYRKAKAPAER